MSHSFSNKSYFGDIYPPTPLLFIYIFGLAGSSLLCKGLFGCFWQASHCSGFLLQSTGSGGTWASVVVLHRLSCSVACGIFLDHSLSGRFLTTGPPFNKNGFPGDILLLMKYVHSEIRIFLWDQCSPKCKKKRLSGQISLGNSL